MDAFVFHQRTPLASGTDALLPVSALATVDPEVFARAVAKYDDTPERRRLRDSRVPVIDRLWTEVVFLSPVHPHAIWQAWREITERERPAMEFWQIPLESLPAGTVWLDLAGVATGGPIPADKVTPLNSRVYRTLTRTTEENHAWLSELAARGYSGAWFHGIPHILSPGPVPLDQATVIDWRDPV